MTKTSSDPVPDDQPFGRGWRILAAAVVAVVVVAIIVMVWGLATH